MKWWQRFLLLILIIAGLVAGFYWWMGRQAEIRNRELQFQPPQVSDEQSEIIVSGVLHRGDGQYYIEEERDGVQILVTSDRVTLLTFVGKKVRITGRLERDRIVVRKIEVLD